MEIAFKGALHLKLHSTTFFATLGLPSVTCGLQDLLHFLPHTMPNLCMMRCTFLRLPTTSCLRSKVVHRLIRPFLEAG